MESDSFAIYALSLISMVIIEATPGPDSTLHVFRLFHIPEIPN